LTQVELSEMEQEFRNSEKNFQDLYYGGNEEYVKMCTANSHQFFHLVECIRICGPPNCYWAFPVEDMMGYVKKETKNFYRLGSVLGNRFVMNQRLNALLIWSPNYSLRADSVASEIFRCINGPKKVFARKSQKEEPCSKELLLSIKAFFNTQSIGYEEHLYSQLSAVDIVESLMIIKYAKLRPAYPLICGSKLDFTKNNSLVLCILQVDKFAHLPNVTPEFVEQDHYFSVLFYFTVGLKGLSVYINHRSTF